VRRIAVRVVVASLAGFGILAVSGPATAARAEDARCQDWNLQVTCVTSVPHAAVSEEFTATVTAKNIGNTELTNVTIRLRGDKGAPCVSGPAAGVMVLIEKLSAGESKELSARFASETIGMARVLGSAKDSLGWTSGSAACTVEIQGLMAIKADMSDKALDGTERGVFGKGEEFLYVLTVENQGGTAATPPLKVTLVLPKELEFISGTADSGITVKGANQSAESSAFTLPAPNGRGRFEFHVKALAVPPSQLVKAVAVIQTVTGVQLASETESTTIK
jgi:uncharacterized repeat protein (TIGR01451 family)